jgi:hypothetical protein
MLANYWINDMNKYRRNPNKVTILDYSIANIITFLIMKNEFNQFPSHITILYNLSLQIIIVLVNYLNSEIMTIAITNEFTAKIILNINLEANPKKPLKPP